MTTQQAVLTDPRDRKYYAMDHTPVRRVTRFLIDVGIPLLMKVEARGLEHFPAREGLVLAANHLTNFDVLVMQHVLDRPIFFMAKKELYTPLTDGFLRHVGAFPIHRGERDEWAMNHARKVLLHGSVLGMFPEGRRSKGAGLRPGKTGIARLALQTHSPIVPMALTGTHQVFRNFPARTPVTIRIAPALHPQAGDTPETLTARLMHTLAVMLPETLRGAYG